MDKINKYLKKLNEHMIYPDTIIQKKIIDYLGDSRNIVYERITDFAEHLGIEREKLIDVMYDLMVSFLAAGKSYGYQGFYNAEQLKAGTIVEAEHSSNPLLAEKIAKDHLCEIPNKYYDYLKAMEKYAEKKGETFENDEQ
jgi:hypothetical protein